MNIVAVAHIRGTQYTIEEEGGPQTGQCPQDIARAVKLAISEIECNVLTVEKVLSH